MTQDQQTLRDNIIGKTLPHVAFEGWGWPALEAGAAEAGYKKTMARAVFPGGIADALDHYADLIDRRMLARLKDYDPEALRIRDRIKTACMIRFDIMGENKEAERRAAAYWSVPTRSLRGGRILWRTADRIWSWAGDTATDYNRYTKRGLLSGVIGSTLLVWLNDESAGHADSKSFFDRRIENVMQWGRFIGRFKKAG